jgi:translation initiation factor 2B subunit (eIF-2B alpha/beta/delta family)
MTTTSSTKTTLISTKTTPKAMLQLEDAVRTLQDDHDNGASVLATHALKLLINLTAETENPYIAQHLWENICSYGRELKNARPSMDAAIGGALLSALSNVKARWDAEFGPEWASGGCRGSKMKNVAVSAIEESIETRKKAILSLAEHFVAWMKAKDQKLGGRPIRILTLSYSSSMKACLSALLPALPELVIDLRILESRPRFEGALLGLALRQDLKQGSEHRLLIQVESDCSVAMLAKDIDIVLLGADRISRSGCVSNKMGSFAAVLCARALAPNAEVVILSESDKIVIDTDLKTHAEEKNDKFEIRRAWGERWERTEKELKLGATQGLVTKNVYFETVEGKHIDRFICETGVLSKEDVKRVSIQRGVKEEEIFGPLKEVS